MIDYPFSGDVYFIAEMNKLITDYNIKSVIETGTWRGRTAQLLSVMCDKVYTIEVDNEYYKVGDYLDDIPNIERFHGDSREILSNLIKWAGIGTRDIQEPVLFFLDAHWNSDDWPLLEELEIISRYELKDSIIIIHDVYNPNNPDLGYDSYKGVRLDFEYVKPKLDKIYGENGYNYYYNSKATGYKRGILYVTPKYFKN